METARLASAAPVSLRDRGPSSADGNAGRSTPAAGKTARCSTLPHGWVSGRACCQRRVRKRAVDSVSYGVRLAVCRGAFGLSHNKRAASVPVLGQTSACTRHITSAQVAQVGHVMPAFRGMCKYNLSIRFLRAGALGWGNHGFSNPSHMTSSRHRHRHACAAGSVAGASSPSFW